MKWIIKLTQHIIILLVIIVRFIEPFARDGITQLFVLFNWKLTFSDGWKNIYIKHTTTFHFRRWLNFVVQIPASGSLIRHDCSSIWLECNSRNTNFCKPEIWYTSHSIFSCIAFNANTHTWLSATCLIFVFSRSFWFLSPTTLLSPWTSKILLRPRRNLSRVALIISVSRDYARNSSRRK